jgi:hypothetical protein
MVPPNGNQTFRAAHRSAIGTGVENAGELALADAA